MFVRVLQNDPNWHTGIVYPVPYAIDRKKLANILVTGGASWIGGWPQRYLRAGSDDGGNRRCEPPRTTQLNSLARSLGLGRLNKRAAKSSALNASETPKKIPRTDMTHVRVATPECFRICVRFTFRQLVITRR
jgi:hypothetical protein